MMSGADTAEAASDRAKLYYREGVKHISKWLSISMMQACCKVSNVRKSAWRCWMSHCPGSPCLVTLVPVCGIQSPRDWDPACIPWDEETDQSRSSRAHARPYRGGRPLGTLDLDDQRLRYDAYHGSTGLPPGSTSAGEPIQHEQAVQGGKRLRKTEMRAKEKSSVLPVIH